MTPSFPPYSMILPSASLGFLCHPVENSWPMSNRGNGWASVLYTTLSSGSKSFGEKSKYMYFNVSA